MRLLEVVVFDSLSGIQASNLGADRVEICDNYYEGGTTPSIGTVKHLIENAQCPVFPMIRPRGGDFCYHDSELEIMKTDIKSFKALGCGGVVFGTLNTDGSINTNQLNSLVDIAYPMEVNFHRAFDRTNNFETAIEAISNAGCTRVLTSGGKPTTVEGLAVIEQLLAICRDKLTVIAGGGVAYSSISALIDIGVQEIHTPVRKMIDSFMKYKNSGMNENLVYSGIDEEELLRMIELMKSN